MESHLGRQKLGRVRDHLPTFRLAEHHLWVRYLLFYKKIISVCTCRAFSLSSLPHLRSFHSSFYFYAPFYSIKELSFFTLSYTESILLQRMFIWGTSSCALNYKPSSEKGKKTHLQKRSEKSRIVRSVVKTNNLSSSFSSPI